MPARLHPVQHVFKYAHNDADDADDTASGHPDAAVDDNVHTAFGLAAFGLGAGAADGQAALVRDATQNRIIKAGRAWRSGLCDGFDSVWPTARTEGPHGGCIVRAASHTKSNRIDRHRLVIVRLPARARYPACEGCQLDTFGPCRYVWYEPLNQTLMAVKSVVFGSPRRTLRTMRCVSRAIKIYGGKIGFFWSASSDADPMGRTFGGPNEIQNFTHTRQIERLVSLPPLAGARHGRGCAQSLSASLFVREATPSAARPRVRAQRRRRRG